MANEFGRGILFDAINLLRCLSKERVFVLVGLRTTKAAVRPEADVSWLTGDSLVTIQ